jgi:hypothetical protein
MSEPDPTGYQESPDTSDGPVAPGADQMEDGGAEGSAALTTDGDAQSDDGVVRPGNQSD